MQEPQRARRNRQDGATLIKSFSCPRQLAEAIKEVAVKEGHNNQSTVIINALTDYLNRYLDVRAA